jgi:hypothetical protein
MVGRSRNCSEPVARLRDPGVSGHSVAQLLCGLGDQLCLCRERNVLARISSKRRCPKCERERDAYASDRPAAQATWSTYCFHALIVMRFRISRKLIRTVTGKAFFDIGHSLKDQRANRRSHLPDYAAWEIHPVMALRVVQAHACVLAIKFL